MSALTRDRRNAPPRDTRVVMRAAALAALVIAGARASWAQAAPPAAGFGALAGFVADSLRGGGLANATVVVVGTSRRATTNRDGDFRIDSIPPGEWMVGVLHPILDTLGLVVASSKMTFVADKTLEVGVQTPALSLIRERLCPRGGANTGPAMLAGRVEDADTDAPVGNASVSIVYLAAGAGSLVQRVRTARTRDDGMYTICGLPSTFAGTVQVTRGGLTSAEIPVNLKDDLLATASFTLGIAAAADSNPERRKRAGLSGRVTDAAGQPIREAQVAVEGGNVVATTDADGRYSLRGLAAGSTETVIRKIGFAPSNKIVHLTNREPRTLNVTLGTANTQILAPVKVTAKLDDGLKKVGFMDRRRIGALGGFLDPEAVDRRQAKYFTDFFRSMPGFSVRMSGSDQMLVATRSQGTLAGCVNVFVDRVPFEQMNPGDLDQAFPAYQIGAIESYPSANDTPMEFQMPGKACATIVAWTRFKLQKP